MSGSGARAVPPGEIECGEVIAKRTLSVAEGPTGDPKFYVQVCAPRPFSVGGGYYCCFKITGPDVAVARWMAGADSMQALLLALKILPIELQSICRSRNLSIYWDREGDDMGFSQPA
jgi:hypothetical protein